MLSNQIITTHYPTLKPTDKISVALQLMDDFDVQHLPILSDNKFIGLVSKDHLLDSSEDAVVQDLEGEFLKKTVKGSEHFLSALKLAAKESLTLIPVVNESLEWIGVISSIDLLKTASNFSGAEESGAIIVLEMERKDYSFGEISRLIETNNAYITQFNTSTETETGLLIVTIKINKQEVSDILATFQRYDYTIRYFIGEEQYENELKYNYDHLMSYLKI